jgi:capsular polysaccharide biosynthesis protein
LNRRPQGENATRRDARGPELYQVNSMLGNVRGTEEATLPEAERPAETIRRVTWRLGVLAILLIVVTAAGAYAVASLREEVYAARSEIAFDLRDLGWDGPERFLNSQPVIARSHIVLTPIAAEFNIPINEMGERLSVETVGHSGIIQLQFVHPNAAMALDVTRAVTTRYLAEINMFDRAGPLVRWVITEPFVLDDPVSPQPLRAAAIGVVAGLGLAAGVVLLRGAGWVTRGQFAFSLEKTRITALTEGFLFLRHRVRLLWDDRWRYWSSIEIPKRRIEHLRSRVDQLTSRVRHDLSLQEVIGNRNPLLLARSSFYRHRDRAKTVVSRINHYARDRFRQSLRATGRRRWGRSEAPDDFDESQRDLPVG